MKPSFVIAGLGNPGQEYQSTRHNLGFRAVEVTLEQLFVAQKAEGACRPQWEEQSAFQSLVCEGCILQQPVLFVQPQTYMNRSGSALQAIMQFYKLDPSMQLLVLCDDIDLAPGIIRLRPRGGAGTHNGLRSIVAAFGEDFARLRIGVGQPPTGCDLSQWVLSHPSIEEESAITSALQQLPPLIEEFVVKHRGEIESIGNS